MQLGTDSVCDRISNCSIPVVLQKKAKLVAIARDVEPIDVILVFPDLCKKMEVPYVVVDDKKQLGTYMNTNTCAVLALTEITPKELKPIMKKILKASQQL